jgi:hypothetical protein
VPGVVASGRAIKGEQRGKLRQLQEMPVPGERNPVNQGIAISHSALAKPMVAVGVEGKKTDRGNSC